jgi:hypothetical protein
MTGATLEATVEPVVVGGLTVFMVVVVPDPELFIQLI